MTVVTTQLTVYIQSSARFSTQRETIGVIRQQVANCSSTGPGSATSPATTRTSHRPVPHTNTGSIHAGTHIAAVSCDSHLAGSAREKAQQHTGQCRGQCSQACLCLGLLHVVENNMYSDSIAGCVCSTWCKRGLLSSLPPLSSPCRFIAAHKYQYW